MMAVLSLFRYRELGKILWIAAPVIGCYLAAKIYTIGYFQNYGGSWENFFLNREGHWWEGRYSSWVVVFLITVTFVTPFYRWVFEKIRRNSVAHALLAIWIIVQILW